VGDTVKLVGVSKLHLLIGQCVGLLVCFRKCARQRVLAIRIKNSVKNQQCVYCQVAEHSQFVRVDFICNFRC